jgi:hypothetical protein
MKCARFEVFMGMKIEGIDFWVMMPYSAVVLGTLEFVNDSIAV